MKSPIDQPIMICCSGLLQVLRGCPKVALTLAFCLVLASSVNAKHQFVKVLRLEVDGKEVQKDFKVLLYVKGSIIEAKRFDDRFVVPEEAKTSNAVGVRIVFGGNDLLFGPVHISKFETDWIVGVDRKPFDEQYSASEKPDPPGKSLTLIHYLSFVPKDGGGGTQMVVKTFSPKRLSLVKRTSLRIVRLGKRVVGVFRSGEVKRP